MSKAATMTTRNNIIEKCDDRKDKWASEVKGRLESFTDLVAPEAVYHHQCSLNFRIGQNIPSKYLSSDNLLISPVKPHSGRPSNTDQQEAFQYTLEYLEHQAELVTLNELKIIMQSKLTAMNSNNSAYHTKTISRKIQDIYKDTVNITHHEGIAGLVTLKSQTDNIIFQFHNSKTNVTDE